MTQAAMACNSKIKRLDPVLQILLLEVGLQFGVLTQLGQRDLGMALGIAVAHDHGDVLAYALGAQAALAKSVAMEKK